MATEFSEITERSGDRVTRGQIADMHHRYTWASGYCRERRVLEVACGTGQGLGLLARTATSVAGTDLEPSNVRAARATYGSRFELWVGSAERLPIADASVDAVAIFEAIYYLPDVDAFLRECRRVLSPHGVVLVTSNNPDLFDFVPSPLSHGYYGAAALSALLEKHGFRPSIYAQARASELPLRHRMMRPLKAVAGRFGFVPRTMRGKQALRRLLYGRLPVMPANLADVVLPYSPPEAVSGREADREHRFVYAAGERVS